MAPRQLSLVRLDDDPREVRIGHRREAGLDPAEDRAPRILPDVPRRRHVPTSTVRVPAELLRLTVRGQRRSSDEGRPLRLHRDHREGPRGRPMDPFRPYIRRPARTDVPDEVTRIILRAVADAVPRT